MIVAVPNFDGRVSPVLDTARQLTVADLAGGASHTVALTAEDVTARAEEILATGAGLVICAAVSRPLESALLAGGVNVHCQVCGAVAEVLSACAAGRLGDPAFVMPGCCGRRGRRRRPVNGAGRGRQGAGRGRQGGGRGMGRRGGGRMGSPPTN